jgi:hypothetical protein
MKQMFGLAAVYTFDGGMRFGDHLLKNQDG